MDTQKQQIVERLQQANNILVTVKSNPTVDHLAACIGLTLALNKMGKHATAVFSGEIPSTIEFLQPEKTLEKNTDSLRDFIIALDKSKADKLRYKVEDKVVKIFITPYRTSINEQDLNFSQGDFNVDVVVALGVHLQTDLDQAITAHGRILHDATIASVNIAEGPNLGTINWTVPNASSLSELVVELMDGIDKKLLDGQIATALLTGIVAETDRFSNNKTSPQTMSISAELMAVGANQQLVATKLAEPPPPPPPPPVAAPEAVLQPAKKPNDDGTLEIEHEKGPEAPQINIDENGSLQRVGKEGEKPEGPAAVPEKPVSESAKPSEAEAAGLPEPIEPPKVTPEHTEGPHMLLEPPTLGGQLSAEAAPGSSNFFDPMMDAASGAPAAGHPAILNREPLGTSDEKKEPSESIKSDAPAVPPEVAAPPPPTPTAPPLTDQSAAPPTEPPAAPPPADLNAETLTDIEKQLNSPHVAEAAAPPPVSEPAQTPPPDAAAIQATDVSNARDAVERAIHSSGDDEVLAPIAALNAQPVDLNLHDDAAPAAPAPSAMPTETVTPTAGASPAPFAPPGLSLPGIDAGVTGATSSPQTDDQTDKKEAKTDADAPPPVPPPMLPPVSAP